MKMISGMNAGLNADRASGAVPGTASGMIHTASAVAGKELSGVRHSEADTQGCPAAPVRDEYVPEEKREPAGRYWLGKDGEGKTKIYFDAPEKSADVPEEPEGLRDLDSPDPEKGAEGPEKGNDSRKAEKCTGNTDKVDREIEKLKKKKEELEKQIRSETDEAKVEDLEKKLAQVERELRQKDNDAYRRQHTVFS